MYHDDENKKAKDTEMCFINRILKMEGYKHCLEATQIENKINQLGKSKVDVDGLRQNNKNNKLILKPQQRLKNEKHNVFTKEVKKTTLSAKNDKRIQSIDLTEAFAYGTSKDLVQKRRN